MSVIDEVILSYRFTNILTYAKLNVPKTNIIEINVNKVLH